MTNGTYMTRRHHHPRSGMLDKNAERHMWRGTVGWIPPDLDADCVERISGQGGEPPRVVPRIMTEDDAGGLVAAVRLLEEAGKPLRGLDDGERVHAREAGLHAPAQTSGAELDAWVGGED